MRYITPMVGSRDSQTYFYWESKEKIQVMCGCFRGNLEQFKKKVFKVHAGTRFFDQYKKQIDIVEFIINSNEK